jgi:signal transduction histidine kinase/CheY-like chemotaxis protein
MLKPRISPKRGTSYDSADPTKLVDLSLARRVIACSSESIDETDTLTAYSPSNSSTLDPYSPLHLKSDPPSPSSVVVTSEGGQEEIKWHTSDPVARKIGSTTMSEAEHVEWDGAESLYERLRREKLESYAVLDTEAEEQFERIVRLCSRLFSVPICLVSLIDSTRQWFKARVGLGAESTPKEISFCRYAISQRYNPNGDVFVVLDALEDKEFASNPLVTGDPSIRFYAGACLKTADGYNLGTLCIIDNKPWDSFSDQDRSTLQDMAQFVIDELELRKKNVELEIAKKKAETADRLKTSFLAHMSHEIRTPMTSLLGLIDLLFADNTLSDEVKHYLQLMKDSGIYLQQILSDILDLSKIEANQLKMEKIAFGTHDVVKDVGDLFRPKAEEKGIYFQTQYLPFKRDECDVKVMGDPTRFRQVLWNLLSNALKFTLQGGITVRISEYLYPDGIEPLISSRPNTIPATNKLSASDLGNTILLRVEVEDTGIGMKESQVQSIFKPFVQADSSTTRQFGGTGLGLSIVEKLVRLMGGTIGVDSILDKGSCFWFSLLLPIAGSHPSRKRKDDSSSQSTDKITKMRKDSPECSSECRRILRLLVAEDNSTIRLLMSRKLKSLGYEFVMATNGEEALKLFCEDRRFDVVLCDMFMPIMDGQQVIQEIRNSTTLESKLKNVPIIAFTADVLNESVEKYLRLGANAVLAKPIDWNRLQELLQSFQAS